MENKTIWGIWECQDIFWRKKIFQEKTTFSEGNLKLQLHYIFFMLETSQEIQFSEEK